MRWQNWIFAIPLRLRSVFRRGRMDDELNEEFQFHLDCRMEAEMATGKNPKEARRAALKAMGGLERQKDSCREARGIGWIDSLWQDLRYAFRSLWKSPAFTLTAVITLALAIGVNTAMFSVEEAVLLRPLPYDDADGLVWISIRTSLHPAGGQPTSSDYLEWRKRATTVSQMAAFSQSDFNLTGIEQPERLHGGRVTSNFLSLLGVQLPLGRPFQEAEDFRGAEPVAIISDGLWQRLYGADPAVLGRSILLEGTPRTIVGVLPDSFEFPGDTSAEVLVPLEFGDQPDWTATAFRTASVLAQLRSGVPVERVAEELQNISRGVPGASATRRQYEIDVEPLRQKLTGDARLTVLVMAGAALMILLIACGNVAHLSLVRSLARQREMAVRKAIGAHRRRLIRQLLTESTVLTALGAGGGLLLAAWTQNLVRAPASTGQIGHMGINAGAMWFTLSAALFTTLASGLGPAVLGSRGELSDVLKSTKGLSERHGARRSPYLLAVTEVGLAIILLAGAGLLLRSLANLTSQQPGFQPENVLTARVSSSQNRAVELNRTFAAEVQEQLRALPGVVDVAVSSELPLIEAGMAGSVQIEGQPPPDPASPNMANLALVSHGYFRTLGIPVVLGRSFLPSDSPNADSILIVNQAFVRRYGLGDNPLAARVMGRGRQWRAIIGVVGDVRNFGLAREPEPEVFELAEMQAGHMFLSIRSATPPAVLAPVVRSLLAEIDPNQPVYDIATMESRLASYVAPWRLHALLLAVFAGLALCMTAVGVYGVMSYQTARRTQEFGIRVALGARPGHLLWMVARQGFAAISVGIAGGLAGALALTRFLSHLLFDIQPVDTATFAAAAAGLFSIGLVAVLLPASRALWVNAVETLREG